MDGGNTRDLDGSRGVPTEAPEGLTVVSNVEWAFKVPSPIVTKWTTIEKKLFFDTQSKPSWAFVAHTTFL